MSPLLGSEKIEMNNNMGFLNQLAAIFPCLQGQGSLAVYNCAREAVGLQWIPHEGARLQLERSTQGDENSTLTLNSPDDHLSIWPSILP